jgi:hypothetical protein
MIAENFLRKKTIYQLFRPQNQEAAYSLSKKKKKKQKKQKKKKTKTVFPAGTLLLCLILAKASGHSLAEPADKSIFIFQHETQNIQSFR